MPEYTVEGIVNRRGGGTRRVRVRVAAADETQASELAADRGVNPPHSVFSEVDEVGKRLRATDRVLTGVGGLAVVAGVLGIVASVLQRSADTAGHQLAASSLVPEFTLALLGLIAMGVGAGLRMLAIMGGERAAVSSPSNHRGRTGVAVPAAGSPGRGG